MGQLIELRPRMASNKDTKSNQPIEKPKIDGNGAKVLFFTGVRYERPLLAPSERLKTLSASKLVN